VRGSLRRVSKRLESEVTLNGICSAHISGRMAEPAGTLQASDAIILKRDSSVRLRAARNRVLHLRGDLCDKVISDGTLLPDDTRIYSVLPIVDQPNYISDRASWLLHGGTECLTASMKSPRSR
jgi:hypothetical protein